jgi:hypothetical protein
MDQKYVDQLKNLSKEMERKLVGWNEEAASRHFKGFADFIKGKRHCHIDANKTLTMPVWKNFFAKLVTELEQE